MYIPQYPIPNTKKGHQKIPFLLTSLHNTDLQSKTADLVAVGTPYKGRLGKPQQSIVKGEGLTPQIKSIIFL